MPTPSRRQIVRGTGALRLTPLSRWVYREPRARSQKRPTSTSTRPLRALCGISAEARQRRGAIQASSWDKGPGERCVDQCQFDHAHSDRALLLMK